ncbi:MAG TPA: HNH endonuclease signature motif containing protein [Marmoricola sp.]|nr:HNH endonuclease signature motif containing protein [Marmoricola sp.]
MPTTAERAQTKREAELSRLSPPTRGLHGLRDRELLLAGRRARMAQSRANAERWQCMAEFYRRRLVTEDQKRLASPHFALTARQETVVEIGSLWGMDAERVRKELNIALFLCEHGAEVWQLCLAGQLDDHRATLIADAARHKLESPEAIARFMTRMLKFLRRHLRGVDGDPDSEPMVTCTVRQLRNAIHYAVSRAEPVRADEEFRRAHEARSVSARDDLVPGMGRLSIDGRVDKVRLADHRLLLAARQKRKDGDQRTIAQLKADLALDLLAGKSAGVPLPTYARPIVNVTVPIQTLMGIADEPGVLSGGTVVPASLARLISQEPGSTWHRMLTDEGGRMVELSTQSYKPTDAIWRQVVAEQSICFRPGCDTASTEVDLDHRVRWPQGPTEPANLTPGCRTDHRAKHAPGFSIELGPDGGFMLRTAAGFRHPIDPTTHPVSDDFSFPEVEDFQYGATELRSAMAGMQEYDELMRPRSPELCWEEDFEEALTDAECRAIWWPDAA